jgi:alcohol dehydrogenase (cytochrome c)
MTRKTAKIVPIALLTLCVVWILVRAQQFALAGALVYGSAQTQRPAPGKAPAPAAGQAAKPTVYLDHCASCHGPDMRGGLGPSILNFIRYHTDAEGTEVLCNKDSVFRTTSQFGTYDPMPVYQLPDPQLRELMAEMRVLAGTNPDMATGGFTGRTFVWGGKNGGFGITWLTPAQVEEGGPKGRIPNFQPRQATLNLTNGKTLQGTLMAQTDMDAELLTPDGNYHLLSRAGDTYRDKPIQPDSNWLTYHGSFAGNRYSTLDQINANDAQKLALAWKFPIAAPRLQATPLVVNGIMYMTGWNELYAIDATTGSPIWSWHEPRTPGILGEAGRGSNRGVAISGNRLFFLTDSAHLIAFNRLTGKILWNVQTGSIKNSVMASSAPLLAGDVVILGVGGGEEGIRGFLDAYNIDTGKHAWRFYTIPKRGEEAAKTWVGEALEHGCGSTWMTGSYDPELGLVYWGVGNPCPDANGSQRFGDNLYTSSVVALSVKTGALKWYFQFTPHDTHDWDSTQSMVLVDRMWEGHERKLLLHADKNGYFYVLDRTDGELLLARPFASRVTWTTGYDKEGRPILTPGWEATFGGTPTCPDSATNWMDPSFDPQNNLFYVRVSDSCGIDTAGKDPLNGDRWYGSGRPDAKALHGLRELMANYQMGEYIRAIDVSTGKKVWDYPDDGRSGALSTAGNVVFISSQSGLTVLNAQTGEEIADVDAGVQQVAPPIFAATPMTYMVGGKQYVVMSGQSTVVAYALAN